MRKRRTLRISYKKIGGRQGNGHEEEKDPKDLLEKVGEKARERK